MRLKPRALLGALIVLVVLAAACGGDDDGDEGATGDGDGGSSDELTPITVGILPLAGLAPLYYGVEQGYFEEEGLDVSMEVGSSGAELAPAVLENDYQFSVGEYLSLMQALENDVPVQVTSNLTTGADAPDQGINALLVGPDSGIESVDDLAGQTFAVSTLENVAEVNIRTTLCRAGVDVSGIQFTELPFPDMNAAVEAGEVDVAWQAEPFVTLGEQSGLVNVADPMYETTPSMPLAGMFASGAWLEEHEEHAAAFYRALQRSIEASSDEQAMRDAIAANTETPPPVVAELALANWQPELDTEKLAFVGELATEYGILEEEPNMDELVWTPPDE